MKKILSICMIGLAVATAHAGSYTIADAPFSFVPAGGTATINLDLDAQSAWNPTTTHLGEVVTGASLFLSLFDPTFNFQTGQNNTETVTISLDGSFWKQPSDFISVTVGGTIAVSLLADNKLSIDVSPVGGPTRIDFYTLNFTTGAGSKPVPDGGSMMALLGLSVLGLGWASRRVRA